MYIINLTMYIINLTAAWDFVISVMHSQRTLWPPVNLPEVLIQLEYFTPLLKLMNEKKMEPQAGPTRTGN